MVFIFAVVGSGKCAGRGAFKLLKRPARFCGRLVFQRRVRPDIVIVVAPERQLSAGVPEAIEQLFVQKFIAQAAVE